MYSQYRRVKAQLCLPLPAGTSAAEGASCFVNPLTALGMVETMRREGHRALVHTAAASNLGQMLNRICLADGIALVNIVRKPEQENLLERRARQRRHHVARFIEDLTEALVETGATIGFDAIGGGARRPDPSRMETAINRTRRYSRYGSTTHKQVYLYGSLDPGPTEIHPQLRHDLGRRRLAALPLPAEDRRLGCRAAE